MAEADTASAGIDTQLLEILRCPIALQAGSDEDARLRVHSNAWLICDASGMKYPIRDGIPVMLVAEAQKWKDIAVDDLPLPPPEE